MTVLRITTAREGPRLLAGTPSGDSRPDLGIPEDVADLDGGALMRGTNG